MAPSGFSNIWDTIVVGAGAAGLMTAITAAREGSRVLLLDGKEKVGAKILMSGGTRCNVTNRNVKTEDFQTENARFLRDVLSTFSSKHAVDFFQALGVKIIEEKGGKYFPRTHSGRTILEALLKGACEAGAVLEAGKKVTQVNRTPHLFNVSGDNFSHLAKTVVLTTGGLSYPASGSDGVGYEMAKSFGHSLIPTSPSLTPLKTDDADWKSLSGITLPCRLTLFLDQKKSAYYDGSFLFTHFGFSGPAALNISRHWIRSAPAVKARLEANFMPGVREDELRKDLLLAAKKFPAQTLKRRLAEKFPDRLAVVFLRKANIHEGVTMNQLTREMRERMIRTIFYASLRVTGALGYEKAEVTAGGIHLQEIDAKTLESKLQPGLFFAGEMLDVDGRIGGFNFQWAWSSGFVAGKGIAKKISSSLRA